jgi:hypothetical protein
LGVKFTYPKNWTMLKIPRASNTSEEAYSWMIPQKWDDNTTQMFFYTDNTTFYEGSNDSNTALNKVQSRIDYYKSNSSLAFGNFTVRQNPTLVTLGVLPAYEFRYSYNEMRDAGHPLLLGKQIWATRGGSLYGITYVGIPNYYNRSLNAADQIISSFEFT